MKRISLALTLVLALAALTVTWSASAMAPPKLAGVVGPGFTITLKKGKAKVAKLKAGRYTFAITDKSSIHNFHLTGPGVNKTTSVAATGSKTWTVTLKKGTYKYVCDPHKTIMKGSFKVT